MKPKYKHIFIVGYSIGATVAWLCSAENNKCDGVIGYYGSRIRDYAELTPKCPVLLFFPKEEKTLNNAKLIEKLDKTMRGIKVLQGGHGFGDSFSKNYNANSKKLAENFVNIFINKITKQD